MKSALQVGQRVRDILGHRYDVVEVSPDGYRVKVQPLTPIGTPATLYPLGVPVWGFRSDFREE